MKEIMNKFISGIKLENKNTIKYEGLISSFIFFSSILISLNFSASNIFFATIIISKMMFCINDK